MNIIFDNTISLSAEQMAALASMAKDADGLFPDHDLYVRRKVSFESEAGSIREAVISATADAFRAVPEIVQSSGFNAKSIRGVLNASDLEFSSTRVDGRAVYKFVRRK